MQSSLNGFYIACSALSNTHCDNRLLNTKNIDALWPKHPELISIDLRDSALIILRMVLTELALH